MGSNQVLMIPTDDRQGIAPRGRGHRPPIKGLGVRPPNKNRNLKPLTQVGPRPTAKFFDHIIKGISSDEAPSHAEGVG